MDTSTLMTVIGGSIVLVLIIIGLVIRFKSKPSAFDKEAANNFLIGLQDVFYEKMIEVISSIDYKQYASLAEAEAYIISEIYDTIWEYTQDKLAEAAKTDILSAMAIKLLNRDMIEDFLTELLKKYEIEAKINKAYGEEFKKLAENVGVEEDAKLTEEFSDSSKYNEDFDESKDLEKHTPVDPTNEDLENINPPKDEEEEYNADDISMEIVDDVYIDASGRKRSKSTGRYV